MFQGQGIVPDITVHPASVTYCGALHSVASELAFNAGISANLPGGNDGGADDFHRSRLNATDKYAVARYGFNYVRQFLADWQARASFTGQYTGNALVSGEQFGIGGPDSVRGYLLRELVNDRGYSGQLELYAPDLARTAGLRDTDRLRPLAFYDFGSVQRNHGLPGEEMRESISSTGLGIRWSRGRNASVRLDVAQVLQATANRQSSSQRIGVALLATY